MGTVEFDKYEALGNDFLVVDAARHPGEDELDVARTLCPRRRGVGADGLLWIHTDTLHVHVINADGGRAETSGNGLRCAARWIVDQGLAREGETIPLISGAGPSPARVERERIAVCMGPPCFPRPDSPGSVATTVERIDFSAAGEAWTGYPVSMGNPHLVVVAPGPPGDLPLGAIAGEAAQHHAFPQGVNVELIHLPAEGGADARVWERGVGETLACGSGACAVAAAMGSLGLTGPELTVRMPGGTLVVTWTGEANEPMWLRGPARRVFTGRHVR